MQGLLRSFLSPVMEFLKLAIRMQRSPLLDQNSLCWLSKSLLAVCVAKHNLQHSPGPTMMVFAGRVLGHSTSHVPITTSTKASHFRVLWPRSHLKPSVNGQLLAAQGSPYCCRSWFSGDVFQSSQLGTSLL